MTKKQAIGLLSILVLVGLAAVLLSLLLKQDSGGVPPNDTGFQLEQTDSAPLVTDESPTADHTMPPEQTRQSEQTQSMENSQSTEISQPPEQTEPVTQQPVSTSPPEDTEPPEETTPADTALLDYSSFGRYSGAFVEDGSDAPVENVAVLLVTNPTDQFLEYAKVDFLINGTPATFVITGLPAGTSAWVLESSRLTIEAGSVFSLEHETTSFSAGGNISEGMTITMGDGVMSAENTSGVNYSNVYVYYRRMHTDGNYLGGITYRVTFGDLPPNTPMTTTAGHCSPNNCQIVKVTRE